MAVYHKSGPWQNICMLFSVIDFPKPFKNLKINFMKHATKIFYGMVVVSYVILYTIMALLS